MLSPTDTAIAYAMIMDTITSELDLLGVPAPLLVSRDDHINDMLASTGRGPVSFVAKDGSIIEVVQSLAKWKRLAMVTYDMKPGQGLYANMHAIRQDEIIGPIHSHHVEQIDWETRIRPEDRTYDRFIEVAKSVYRAIRTAEISIIKEYPILGEAFLPKKMHIIKKDELDLLYPGLSDKEKEDAIAKIHGSVLITCIGSPSRSWEYDDWSMNGDIIIWSDRLNMSVEITSMGIRVDDKAMMRQAEEVGAIIPDSDYHRGILDGTLPPTVGGGLGKARIAMLLLKMSKLVQ